MRNQWNGELPSPGVGLLALALAVSMGMTCVCCQNASNHARLLDAAGYMREFNFSADGIDLIVNFNHYKKDPSSGSTILFSDSLTIFEVASGTRKFELVLDEQRNGDWPQIGGFWTCADRNTIVHNEWTHGTRPEIVFRDMVTGQERRRLTVDRKPDSGKYMVKTYFCDLATNIIYARFFDDRIVALDGTSGETLREYPTPGLGDGPELLVQPERDRLQVVDLDHHRILRYRLTTAEPLSDIQVLDPQTEEHSSAWVLMDEDHVVWGTTGVKSDYYDTTAPINLYTIDLATGEVGPPALFGEFYYLAWMYPMKDEDYPVLVVVDRVEWHDAWVECFDRWAWDPVGQNKKSGISSCDYSWSAIMPVPDLERIVVSDVPSPSGKPSIFYSFDYPSFSPVGESDYSTVFEEWEYSPAKRLIVIESSFEDRFGIYDPVGNRILDDFHICDNVIENSLRLAPGGRWAGVLCYGKSDGTGQYAPRRGAGVAVVDLERYGER